MYNINEKISLPRIEIKMDVKIKEKLENLFNYLSNALSSVHSGKYKKDYPKSVSSIKRRLLYMAEILDESGDMISEYYAFLKIKKMIYYVLENIEYINPDDRLSIFNLFFEFKLLMLFKFSYLEGMMSKEEYQTKFDGFLSHLEELREHFFLNVYVKYDGFDDVTFEVANILLK